MEVNSPGTVEIGQSAPRSFSLLTFLFNPKGRINRAKMWGFEIARLGVIMTLAFVAGLAAPADTDESTIDAVLGLLIVASLYPNVVVGVKRLHDRNKSGWFWLLNMIPLVNIWMFIEMYFLAGTPGENRFGPEIGSTANRNALVDTFR